MQTFSRIPKNLTLQSVYTIVVTNELTGKIMATINIRIDDNLKTQSFAALEELGVTPSDVLRQTLEYVAVNHKLPFHSVLVNDDDLELL